MKILFMGTPEFSVEIVNGLYLKHEIVAVVTQPDKPVGRKKELVSPPVKRWAMERNILVFQPVRIKDDYEQLIKLNPDIIVTAAYGQFVGMKLLNSPRYRAINVHASLLPKYRGGAPIHQAIKAGEKETGVSIIYMERNMDSGDILATQVVPILDDDTGGSMFHKLSIVGRDLVIKVLEDIEHHKSKPMKQDNANVTYANNITSKEELIDFTLEANSIRNHIRAYNPTPGTHTLINGEIVKIYEANVNEMKHNQLIGSIVDITKESFIVACGNHTTIEVTTIKPQGKNTMSVRDYLNGNGKQVLKNIEKVGI
jgi:methionyl-tRNA formyltransferase